MNGWIELLRHTFTVGCMSPINCGSLEHCLRSEESWMGCSLACGIREFKNQTSNKADTSQGSGSTTCSCSWRLLSSLSDARWANLAQTSCNLDPETFPLQNGSHSLWMFFNPSTVLDPKWRNMCSSMCFHNNLVSCTWSIYYGKYFSSTQLSLHESSNTLSSGYFLLHCWPSPWGLGIMKHWNHPWPAINISIK